MIGIRDIGAMPPFIPNFFTALRNVIVVEPAELMFLTRHLTDRKPRRATAAKPENITLNETNRSIILNHPRNQLLISPRYGRVLSRLPELLLLVTHCFLLIAN